MTDKELARKLCELWGSYQGIYFNYKSGKDAEKIKKAKAAFHEVPKDETILFCYDETLFGGADNGFVATEYGIYVRNSLEEPQYFSYDSIESVEDAASYKVKVCTQDGIVNIDVTQGKKKQIIEILNVLADAARGDEEVADDEDVEETDEDEDENVEEIAAAGVLIEKKADPQKQELRYCANCGTQLPEGAKFCMECGTPAPKPRPTHCPNCGAKLLDGAKFCMECGTKIEA